MQNVLLLTQTTARLLAGSQPDEVSHRPASPFFLRFRCLPPVGIESYLRRLGLDGVRRPLERHREAAQSSNAGPRKPIARYAKSSIEPSNGGGIDGVG